MPKRLTETLRNPALKQVRNPDALNRRPVPPRPAPQRAFDDSCFDVVSGDGLDHEIDEFRRRLYGSDD